MKKGAGLLLPASNSDDEQSGKQPAPNQSAPFTGCVTNLKLHYTAVSGFL
jgi:hypothetical protein